MNKTDFWNTNNVSTFNGYDVENGEVTLSDSEWADYLTDVHGCVVVCGQQFDSGDVLLAMDETAFRCGKNDYEAQLDSELETQLDREDSDNIEFIDGDEWDLDEDQEGEE